MSKFEWSRIFVPLILAVFVGGSIAMGNITWAQEKAPDSPGATTSTEETPAEATPEKKLTTEEEIAAMKEETATTNKANKVAMDTIWVMVTGMLVFFMNLG